MAKVIRITRHVVDLDRVNFLKGVYGDDVQVVTEDIPYGEDPVASVKALIERHQADDHQVVAVEATAPFPVLMKLVERRRELGVALIRTQFARDESGRVAVVGKEEGTGRDLFKFGYYEELEKIEFFTRRLGSATSP